MSGLFEAALRGAGQGASFNWGDEGAAKLLGALPGPADPEGIPREYAAGSPEADYLQKFRRDNAAAAQAHPGAYTAGQMVGALPSAAAVPGGAGLSAAGRVAASGLAGGALGALSGAGGATEGNRVHEGAKGALLGSLLGTGSTAALEGAQAAAPVVKAALGRLRAPQVAEAGPQINRAAMLPPAEDTAEAASSVVPKIPEAKTGVRESMIPKMDELAEHADVVHGDKMMQRPSSERDVENFVRSRDKVKDALGRKPSNETPAQATVRPPRKLRGAQRRQEPVQTELDFPKPEPEPTHWLDDPNIERLPTKGTPAERGDYDTHVATFKTPQGIKQALAKRGTGADDHLYLGIPGETMADREAAAHAVSKAIKPDAPVVPKTVSRDGESLQEFVHAPNTWDLDSAVAADPEKYAQQMKDTNILDLLIRNPDRHGGNVFWRGGTEPVAIDHNLTFGSGLKNSTPHRVPFEHPSFENAVTEAPDAATMNTISAKKVAEAVKPVKGISDSQKADMLGRLRDLQYNPDQLKGLSMPEVTQWMGMTPKQRGLSDVDLHDISQLLGQRSPIRPGTPLKLKGTKPLEGEQLSLEDLLKGQ